MVTAVYYSIDELDGVGVIELGLCPPLRTS